MIEGILMLSVSLMCLAGCFGVAFVIVPDVGFKDLASICFSVFLITVSLVVGFLGLLFFILSVAKIQGDKIPYQVRYEEKCEIMGGDYRSESVHSVATKTTNTSHYCKINGFEFEDIGA